MRNENRYMGPKWSRKRLLNVPTWPHDTEYMIHQAIQILMEDEKQ